MPLSLEAGHTALRCVLVDIGWTSNYCADMVTHDDTIALLATARGRANAYLMQLLKERSYEELAPSHGNLLYGLSIHGPMTMSGLAAVIRRDKSTVTALVDKLEELGYVMRTQDPADNRVRLVALTPKAEQAAEDFSAISEELLERALRGLSSADRQQLRTMLLKIIDNLG